MMNATKTTAGFATRVTVDEFHPALQAPRSAEQSFAVVVSAVTLYFHELFWCVRIDDERCERIGHRIDASCAERGWRVVRFVLHQLVTKLAFRQIRLFMTGSMKLGVFPSDVRIRHQHLAFWLLLL